MDGNGQANDLWTGGHEETLVCSLLRLKRGYFDRASAGDQPTDLQDNVLQIFRVAGQCLPAIFGDDEAVAYLCTECLD